MRKTIVDAVIIQQFIRRQECDAVLVDTSEGKRKRCTKCADKKDIKSATTQPKLPMEYQVFPSAPNEQSYENAFGDQMFETFCFNISVPFDFLQYRQLRRGRKGIAQAPSVTKFTDCAFYLCVADGFFSFSFTLSRSLIFV